MTALILALLCTIPNQYKITCDGRDVVVEPERVELQDYVPLKSVAEALGVNYIMDNNTQRAYLTANGRRFVLIPDITSVRFNDTYYNMPFAPIYKNGSVYFPVQLITTTLGSAFEKLVFIKRITEVPAINKVSIFTRGDSTIMKFSWPRPVGFDVRFSTKQAIVEIDGVYKDRATLKAKGAIKHATLTPHTTYTSIELGLEGVNSVIERADEVVFYYKISDRIGSIVIDPGHGGVDPGAVGKKGLYEKDVNLAIGKVLRQLVEDSLKIKVVMTRDRDYYLSLKERSNIANRNAADLFVSLHCNASMKGSRKSGFETYFLSAAKTNEERAVAARENASLQFDDVEMTNDDISFIFYDLAQSAYLYESNRFAEYVQVSAEKHLGIPSRGVKQAGFYVLHGAFMPAVLIECAFISNPDEEKKLRQKQFRQELAYCIFRGIREYIEDYERRVNN